MPSPSYAACDTTLDPCSTGRRRVRRELAPAIELVWRDESTTCAAIWASGCRTGGQTRGCRALRVQLRVNDEVGIRGSSRSVVLGGSSAAGSVDLIAPQTCTGADYDHKTGVTDRLLNDPGVDGRSGALQHGDRAGARKRWLRALFYCATAGASREELISTTTHAAGHPVAGIVVAP